MQPPVIAATDERYELAIGAVFTRRAGMAHHPERETLEALEGVRRTLGSDEFDGAIVLVRAPRVVSRVMV